VRITVEELVNLPKDRSHDKGGKLIAFVKIKVSEGSKHSDESVLQKFLLVHLELGFNGLDASLVLNDDAENKILVDLEKFIEELVVLLASLEQFSIVHVTHIRSTKAGILPTTLRHALPSST
jgi:hypothetical protein